MYCTVVLCALLYCIVIECNVFVVFTVHVNAPVNATAILYVDADADVDVKVSCVPHRRLKIKNTTVVSVSCTFLACSLHADHHVEKMYRSIEKHTKYKVEIAAITQKQEMTESTAKMRSGRIVAESEHKEKRFVTEAVAAPHSIGNAFAKFTEFEHPDGRTVVDLSEETNAAATNVNVKAKRRDDMSMSQENKNEKTSKGDEEIRRLVGKWRNTAKDEIHKLKELSKRIKTCIRGRKRAKRQEKYDRFLKNSEASKVYHA